jgi:DNA mismatch repair protein MutS
MNHSQMNNIREFYHPRAQVGPKGIEKTTPMIQQYLQIKEAYPDAILFYRMGDFYEMFFGDALTASKILEIALTSREKDKEKGIPMCGVPYHSATSHISKLIKSGHKVAICEQVQDPKEAKGLVKREVVRVITPGLVLDPDTLPSDENNYLLGILAQGAHYGLAVLDVSTGEFRVTEVAGERALLSEGERIQPKEVLLPEDAQLREGIMGVVRQLKPAMVNFRSEEDFRFERAKDLLLSHFRVHSLDGFGCEGMGNGIRAAGAVLRYARDTQGDHLPHIRNLLPYHLKEYMILDDWTRRNLELFENLQDRSKHGSLIGILDHTLTPLGSRTLKKWLSYPLLSPVLIGQRLDAVEELVDRGESRDILRAHLAQVRDLERLISRISMGAAHARDLVSLKQSLRVLPSIKQALEGLSCPMLVESRERLDLLEDVVEWIQETLVNDPPLNMREGGLIREGVDSQLDEWIQISREGKNYIARMEARERERTGIPSLKIGYNKVFGYYMEVTKTHSELVPAEYTRKQTLVNAERYINEELKTYELKVTGAEERRTALEYDIFVSLRERVASQSQRVQGVADLVARLDIWTTLAEVALSNRYVRPIVDDGTGIWIKDGRHPVVENMGLDERFVPNNLDMDPSKTQMIILTGPNMAGKSTYLRQVALVVLMAQAGCFVPASEARIGVVDRIFTRVGALDNLARGQSTFMVEMNETGQILHHATPRSLIILDEIGRGTSTFDGISIAWAVAEYILENAELQAKTLFATHYHELTELALTKERVKNYHIAVKEWEDHIIFIRRVIEGGTSRSYGIQVARLAGLPQRVIDRAQEILVNLEKGELDAEGQPRLALSETRRRQSPADSRQLNLFAGSDGRLQEELRKVELDTLTPLEALNILHKLKESI